jgi:ankyrin repeat protein
MVAVWHGQTTVAECLLRASADVDAVNNSGVPALILAVIKSPTLVRLCISSNCQLNVQEKTVCSVQLCPEEYMAT